MPVFFPPLVAFAMTFASLLLLKPLAVRIGLVDEPGGRKQHAGNIPLIGGIAMTLGLVFGVLTLPFSLLHFRCLLAMIVLLSVTGLLDDFHELTPRSRLFIQILAGIFIALWGNIRLQTLGNLFGSVEIQLGFLTVPFTVLAVVAIINAVNMTDGSDGLAGSIAGVEFFFLAWLAHQGQRPMVEQFIYLVLSVLLAFLCFNFPWRQKASVFMGDSGSMVLGLLLVWFCIDLSQPPHPAAAPAVFLWIAAIPLFDISSVVWRRVRRGISPFRADRGHLHHYLLRRGFSLMQVALLISALAAVCGFMGIASAYFHLPQPFILSGFLLAFVLYMTSMHWGWQKLEKSLRYSESSQQQPEDKKQG